MWDFSNISNIFDECVWGGSGLEKQSFSGTVHTGQEKMT